MFWFCKDLIDWKMYTYYIFQRCSVEQSFINTLLWKFLVTVLVIYYDYSNFFYRTFWLDYWHLDLWILKCRIVSLPANLDFMIFNHRGKAFPVVMDVKLKQWVLFKENLSLVETWQKNWCCSASDFCGLTSLFELFWVKSMCFSLYIMFV